MHAYSCKQERLPRINQIHFQLPPNTIHSYKRCKCKYSTYTIIQLSKFNKHCDLCNSHHKDKNKAGSCRGSWRFTCYRNIIFPLNTIDTKYFLPYQKYMREIGYWYIGDLLFYKTIVVCLLCKILLNNSKILFPNSFQTFLITSNVLSINLH